jgi:HEAT repeat protein
MTRPFPDEYFHYVALLFANTAVQIALLFGVGLLLTAAMRRSAAARHTIWLFTLCGMLLTPIVAILLPAVWFTIDIPNVGSTSAGMHVDKALPNAPATGTVTAAADAVVHPVSPLPRKSTQPPNAHELSGLNARTDEHSESSPESTSDLPVSRDPPASAISAWITPIEKVILALWLVGLTIGLARLIVGLRRVQRLRANGQVLDGNAYANVLNDVRQRLPAGALPTIAWSNAIASPAAVGLFKPLVLLPASLRDMLSAQQLRDVLVHECAHVARRDRFVGLLQRLTALLFWPHPLVHVLNRRLAQAREELCDNFVLRGGRAADYAETLLTLSIELTEERWPLLSHGILQPRWKLEDRVRGLLDKRRNLDIASPVRSRAVLSAACAVSLLSVAGIQLVDHPVVANEPISAVERQVQAANNPPADAAVIDQWVQQLALPEAGMRIEAMQRLRLCGPQAAPATRAIVALLTDETIGREARLTLARIGEPAVPDLIGALKSEDEQVRWWAAQALEEIGPAAKAAIPALVASFEDPVRPVQNAASALAGMGTLALRDVTSILADPKSSPDARVGAAQTIASIGPRAKETIPLLTEALKDDRRPARKGSVSVQQAAIRSLGAIGPEASGATMAIISFLSDKDRNVRLSAVEALGNFGPGAAAAVPALTAVLNDEYEELPARAAEALGRIGPSARPAAASLVQLLLHLDGEVNGRRRQMVATALGQIGATSSAAVLTAYRSGDSKDRIRLIPALGEIGIQHEQVLAVLISAIETRDSSLRLAALDALNIRFTALETHAKPAIPSVIESLTDPDLEVRSRAALTLFLMGPIAEEAIPALVRLLDDSEFQVRKEAVWALLSVGPKSDATRKAIEYAMQDRDEDVRRVAARALELIRSGSSATRVGELLRTRMFNLQQVADPLASTPPFGYRKMDNLFAQVGTYGGVRDKDTRDSNGLLADLVRDFNTENKKLERGLDQPPLTQDEVVAVIQGSQWKPGEPTRSEREFTLFKSIADTRQLPKEAYFAVWTRENPSTFVVNHIWSIYLYLPSIDGDGFDGYPIRHTKLGIENIDPTAVAWGKPDPDGLSLGGYISPRKDKYALGERVSLLLFVRNDGRKRLPMSFANTTHPMPDDFTVTDEKGSKVDVCKGEDQNWSLPWVSGYLGGELGVGDVHRFNVPFEISIGGDASNKLVGRVIDARPGQTVRLTVRANNGSDRARADGEPEPETGVLTFAVVNAASNEPEK